MPEDNKSYRQFIFENGIEFIYISVSTWCLVHSKACIRYIINNFKNNFNETVYYCYCT